MDGFVYLLGDWDRDGIYKIGVTRGTIDKRIKKLQTGNAGEIYIVDSFKTNNPFFIEQQLHFKYKNKTVINEWFELTDEEALSFKESCQAIEDMVNTLKDNPFFQKHLKK